MASKERKTFFFRGEDLWATDKQMEQLRQTSLPNLNDLFSSIYSFYSTAQIKDLLRKQYPSESNEYVTKDEFNELKQQFQKMQTKMETICPAVHILPSAIIDELKVLQTINGISKAFYRFDNNNLTVYLVVNSFSEIILTKISKLEIDFSRKHPELSVEFEPIFHDEEIEENVSMVWEN